MLNIPHSFKIQRDVESFEEAMNILAQNKRLVLLLMG